MESVDATNAQLALSGMYVRKSQKQLLAQEEGEKSKEDGGQVKGTFGRVVTHKGFVKGQGVCAQKKITEAEMDQLREEAKAQWKGFNDTQKEALATWKVEKEHLTSLKQKVPLKPSAILMRDWMAENYPQLKQGMPSEANGTQAHAEDGQEGGNHDGQ